MQQQYASSPNTESRWASIIGFSVMLASIQFSVGSVEMSSKFSVASFAKDQTTLQRAADALRMYMYIAMLWTAACCLVLFGAYGWQGATMGLASNMLVVLWIYASYFHSFKLACKRHDLDMPHIMPWTAKDERDEKDERDKHDD
jgi:hypothetical protein